MIARTDPPACPCFAGSGVGSVAAVADWPPCCWRVQYLLTDDNSPRARRGAPCGPAPHDYGVHGAPGQAGVGVPPPSRFHHLAHGLLCCIYRGPLARLLLDMVLYIMACIRLRMVCCMRGIHLRPSVFAHWWAVDGSHCRHGSALRLPRRGRSVDGRALHLRGRRSLLDSCGPRWRHLRDIAQAVCRRPPGFVLGLLDVRAMTRVHAGGPLCQYNDHSTNDKELHVREMAA